MSETDRLAEIRAHYPDGRDLWEKLEHSFEHYRSFFKADAETIDSIDRDIRWLIAEVTRLREVMDGDRTPKQLMQRLEVIQLAGVPSTAEVIAYADQLLDKMEHETQGDGGGRDV